MTISALLALLLATGPAADEWAEALGYALKHGGSKDPAERARAASGLAAGMDGRRDAQAAKLLLAILQGECARDAGGKKEHEVSGEVLRACEETLGKASAKDAVALLVQQARRHPVPRVRFHLARALGAVRAAEALQALLELASDRDPRVAVGACDGLAGQADPSSLARILELLRDPAVPWEGRLALVEACEKIDRPEASVDGLIEALGPLPDDQGRLKVRIMKLLGKFCGVEDPRTDDAAWWKTAWGDRKAGRDPSQQGFTAVEPTEFFGLKTRSTRIVFVLDRTGSMEDPCTFPPPEEKPPPPRSTGDEGPRLSPPERAARAEAERILAKWEAAPVRRKIEGLKKEFVRTIFNLDPRVRFSVVWYESNPTPWKTELVPATWGYKLECLRDIEKLAPSGPTNVWGGLETAYRLVEAPQRPEVIQIDKKGNYAVLVRGADTFFLMTDGNHNTGKFASEDLAGGGADTEAFLSELRKVNALRRAVIHVVALGDSMRGGDPLTPQSLAFLRRVAEETGGQFTHIGRK